MTRYSVQLRDNSKNLSGKYSEKLLGHAKQPATDVFKTALKRAIQKIAEAIGDLIGNKIGNRIAKFEKIHNKIIQKQIKISMIKKYLKKDIYFQKKDMRLLMNWG